MADQAVKKTRKPAARTAANKRRSKRGKTRKAFKLSLNRSDRFTILWLLLFFPIGLTRMWKEKCHWKSGIKYAVSGLFAAITIAILFVPSPYRHLRGGVEIVTEDPEVEIYGPSAPQTIVGGYTSTKQESVVSDPTDTSAILTVFAADDGKCYHLGDCKFAFASAKRLTVYEAYYLGYKPCGKCEPPVYDPITGTTVDRITALTSANTDTQTSVFADEEPITEEDLNNPDNIV